MKRRSLRILQGLFGAVCLLTVSVLPGAERADDGAMGVLSGAERADDGAMGENNGGLATKINGVAAWTVNGLGIAQAGISTNFLAAVARLDRIFGDDRLVEDANTSRVTLGLGVQASRFDGVAFRHETRARLSLPRMQDRLMLELNQLTTADDIETTGEIRSAYEDTRPDLGLRLRLLDPAIAHLTASTGLRLGSSLQMYGRIRASRTFLLAAQTSLYTVQTLQYYTEDRWTETSALRLSHCIFANWVLETAPSLTWREREPGYEPALMVSAMHQHKEKRALRFDVGGEWPETPHTRESRYFVQGTRRWRLGRPWLFGELRLGVAFPEKEGFASDPFVRAMIEMVIGK